MRLSVECVLLNKLWLLLNSLSNPLQYSKLSSVMASSTKEYNELHKNSLYLFFWEGEMGGWGIQFRDRGSVADLGGFFYCPKNWKNPLLPRKQWKVGVVSLPQQ